MFQINTRFETSITRNVLNGLSFFHLYYLITLMATCAHNGYQCPNQVFYDWLKLIRCWKRDSRQIMIVLNVASTWSIVKLNVRSVTWIAWNVVNGISLYHVSYLITLMASLCTQRTFKVQIKYFMFECSIYRLFVTNRCSKRDSLQILIFEYVCSAWGIIELKTHFDTWITRKVVNGVSLFHLSYLITLMAYVCSQWAPSVQIK
jgi:hypothetical protein